MGFLIYLAISGFLGFCGFVDCLVQPAQAWRNARKHKGLWLLITFVGMITLVAGWVTWAAYSYGGTRRAIKRGGGYNRPSREMGTRQQAGYVLDEIAMRQRGQDGDQR